MTVRPNHPGSSIGGLTVRRPTTLDDAVLALLRAPTNVCVISTLAAAGGIHARAVWVDTDGDHVLLNTVVGRVWEQDVARQPVVACTIVNAANPYEFASIEGRVVETSTEEGATHIDALARKYLGVATYPFHNEQETRVRITIAPDRVLHVAPESPELG
jgi:PPOX class probable F420-dependent enzyme